MQELRAKRKAGEKLKNKGSGFGGKGFKFDEAEQKRLTDAAAKTKKLLLIQNGEEVSEEEDAAAAAGDAGDDFEEQAANLNAQYHQKYPTSPCATHAPYLSRGQLERALLQLSLSLSPAAPQGPRQMPGRGGEGGGAAHGRPAAGPLPARRIVQSTKSTLYRKAY